MLSWTPSSISLFSISKLTISTTHSNQSIQFQFVTPRIFLCKNFSLAPAVSHSGNTSISNDSQPSVILDSLRVLEWDQLCDTVASFAGTSLGKQATKAQLWNLNKMFDESVKLLEETDAAVEMHKYGAMMDFSGIDISLVKTGIQCAGSGFPVSGDEAMALVSLLQFAEALQLNVKAATKKDSEWYQRFMPLSGMIMELVVSQSLIKFIQQLIDEDGSVKDSASSTLRQARGQVRFLERKLYQLLESMIRNEAKETSILVIPYSSGSGGGSIFEPLSAVPLNDELQRAMASVAKAESEVLLKITNKVQMDINDIEHVLNVMIQMDMINARARYSLLFDGSRPELYLPQDKDSSLTADALPDNKTLMTSKHTQGKWTLYLPKAYHPLLLQQHRHDLRKAMKDVSNANAELRRRKQQGGNVSWKEEISSKISSLQTQVAKLKQTPPVPFDIFIAWNTKVVVITGPNTGGKTICLKTVGLAAMMAKSGIYVLSSEPVKIPWFDSVFADIGDEQSLSQSLSTFTGHLKQISEIKSHSSNLSLVLLDEVWLSNEGLDSFGAIEYVWLMLFLIYPLMLNVMNIIRSLTQYSENRSASFCWNKRMESVHKRLLYQLLESMIRNEAKETSILELSNIDGRWCIKSGADIRPSFEGLLLSSGSGGGSIFEPLSAVPLNDELQRAMASVAKAESEVLLKITNKVQMDINDIEHVLNVMIQMDMINARARYSLLFDGSRPELYLPQDKDSSLTADALPDNKTLMTSKHTQGKWTLYLPKAYHPLLLQQHRHDLRKAMKDVSNANAELRRRKQQGGNVSWKEEISSKISCLQTQVAKLKQTPPVPFDIFIAWNTKVVVITGPNTGGKTICLKTVGLAAMMAKSGLYVLSSEPVKIPWFDSVFADIGDEQSLSQSLSTFSGHLKQISEIKSHSSNLSLVLLDEVGAGTNPLEGAALGMSLLESFAETGALLTIASTHHGELKTLKYSNVAFENACMEFDEVNLKPTYRILWGIPGRSNAINIAERLGIPNEILDNARELYGAASAEINEIIVDMERSKKNFHKKVHEAQHHLMLSKNLHHKLLVTRKKIVEHGIEERYRMMQEVSDAAAVARSILHKKLRIYRSFPNQPTEVMTAENNRHNSTINDRSTSPEENEPPVAIGTAESLNNATQSVAGSILDVNCVHVSVLLINPHRSLSFHYFRLYPLQKRSEDHPLLVIW
ncbi:endonuclease 2 [Olea europaea subsp. europaea]|uniref:Endonuclease 2 n=1 Tax=Olea europaea subsp. europaea TaxID=158383 RepID=A0A8S0PU31_OLEEU|nr:endonuclease 2 [Olea europaea subsp. europaea]